MSTTTNQVTHPSVSVVLPLYDVRGISRQCIESWINQQCDAEAYELIVVIEPGCRNRFHVETSMLREHDRVLENAYDDVHEQYNFAAEQARGRFLVLTEAHLIASPDVIGKTLDFYRNNPDSGGFSGRPLPLPDNHYSILQGRYIEHAVRYIGQSKHPGLINLIICSVKTELFTQFGGFNLRYGRFGEWVLALELQQGGTRLRYQEDITVYHRYDQNLPAMDEYRQNFVRGECLYRMDHRNSEAVRTAFGNPHKWNRALKIADKLYATPSVNVMSFLYYKMKILILVSRTRLDIGASRLLIQQRWLSRRLLDRSFSNYWHHTADMDRIESAFELVKAQNIHR